jgi:CheY-like chemotaxis protein/anti-sigma regulatory factor (Ser/Thr protein kinase)
MEESGKSILVVEDDPTTRRLAEGLLASAGYAVTTAADGAEALEKLHTASFDLALVDVWMPGMTGLELVGRLRARSPDLRVVIMTSDDTPTTLLRAVAEQADRYIPKPLEAKELLATVHRVLAARPSPYPIEVVSAQPDWVELLVPCERAAAERIQSFLARLDAGLPEEVRDAIGRAFHELLMNAMEWGGGFDPARRVRISYLRFRRMLLYRIADPGKGFRFEELKHAAVGNEPGQPLEHLRVREEKGMRAGGFGLALTRALVDELLYNEAHNEVVFVKYLE